MKKRKWLKKILVLVLVLALVFGAAAGGIYYFKSNSSRAVEVYAVSDINAIDWIGFGDMEGASGTVVSDVSQNVHIPDDKVIHEVYVEEGDSVKVGDKLLAYDTTLLELDQELQELVVMELGMEIKSAEADLKKLQNTTPVAKSGRDEEEFYGLYDTFDSDWDWDSDEDEARLILPERSARAAQEDAEHVTESAQVQTAAEEQVTVLEQTESSETEAEHLQSESVSASEGTESDTVPETEQILGEAAGGITESLSPDDLNHAPVGNGEKSVEEIMGSLETEAPELNQKLQPFLNNIRIKEQTADQQEVLVVDTIQYEEGSEITAAVSGAQINIIPHFKENPEHRFEKLDTYMMYIKGIRLEKEIAGKLYGTAVIDGNDYPEIGGFTCVQDTKSEAEDVVKLTLAFHDGLDKQHMNDALLADMYLELRLTQEELVGESLLFRTSEKEEEDRIIYLTKPLVTEPESEMLDVIEDALMDDLLSAESETVQESDTFGETEIVPEGETGKEAETDQVLTELEEETFETESETESDTGTASPDPVTEFRVTVSWDHGTNDREKWPTELALLFYDNQEDLEPVYKEMISEGYEENGGSGIEDGEEEPETETEWDMSEVMTGDPVPEESETETEDGTAMSEEIEDPEDPYDVTYQVWKDITVSWPLDRLNPDQYYMTVYAANYLPTVTWDAETKHYTIQMKYLEPVESPLLKLEPLSELNFASGMEGMYYKGSGTAEDPFVFFCTDGAVIRSSFVNWVLGFDELGTTRISDGYYVELEIRESDSITGAFIRSVGLDGTVRVEYGYDPLTYWVFSSDTGIVKYQEEVMDDSSMDFPGNGFDPGWSDIGESYTAEELAYAIAEKEREIRQLKVDEKKAQLELKKYNQEMEESVVLSSVNGIVQSLGGAEDSDAYMVVASETGFYVKTTVNEMDLDRVEVGQVVNCTSWETGMMFTATITQIDYFPTSTSNSDYYWSGGNVNSSSYPILAVVDDSEMVSEYESVSVKLPAENTVGGSGVYLEKAYIRSENGQSYVYIADSNGLLQKQYIRTGGNSYGYIEIKEGLSNADKIAFPYGKHVKAGAKTVDAYSDYY